MPARTWRDRVSVVVEAGVRGVAVGGMVWDVSQWDEATWSGLEPEWSALGDCVVEQFAIVRGRSGGFGRHSVGTCELSVVWPAPEGRWSFRPTAPVSLGQELRLRLLVPGASDEPIPLYRGMIRSLTDEWTRDGPFRIRARMVDRFNELGAVDLPEASSAVGLGDLTHERILRILALAEIPEARAVMGTNADDSGTVQHQSSTFARNLLEEAWTTVEGEAGSDLVVGRDGLFGFRRARYWMAPEAGTPNPRWNESLLTWTNDPSGAPLEFCPVTPGGFATGRNLDDVVNRVSYARAGGTAQTAEDSDSIIRYGLRTYQRMDLTNRYDTDVLANAELRVAELAERSDVVEALRAEFDPSFAPAEALAFLDVDLGDQHAVRWDDGAGAMAGTFHVQGIRHRVTRDHWTVELNLWAYAGNGLEPVEDEIGRWDSARWDVSVWGP